MEEIETKLFNLSEVKFASSEDDTSLSFSGYGAVFNNIDRVGDVIAKGAFKDAVTASDKPLMFLNHDHLSLPIGTWLTLEEDDHGLKMSGRFIDTQAGRDAYVAAKAGAIKGLSIGYRVKNAVKSEEGGRRKITDVELLEVSLVTFPANVKAMVESVKSDITQTTEFNDAVEAASAKIEAKYQRAALTVAVQNLCAQLLGDK